jgi:methionyl-tRNA synthetase
MTWANVGTLEGLSRVDSVGVLFQKLEADKVAELREKYSGSQKERAVRDAAADANKISDSPAPTGVADALATGTRKPAGDGLQTQKISDPAAPKPIPYAGLPVEERFARLMDLRVAKIIKIERHPKADKLYIETLDDGSGVERVIVSGLVPFYAEEELLGKSIVLVNNLKPAKLRGVESKGMLLAASKSGAEGKEVVEVLDAPWAAPGTRVVLEGQDPAVPADAQIDADAFFSVPLIAKDSTVFAGAKKLTVAGTPFTMSKVSDGEVG